MGGRITVGLAGGLISLSLSGCLMCCHPNADAYPVYGGKWERTDRFAGRVGSVFRPAGHPVGADVEAPFEWSEAPGGESLEELSLPEAATEQGGNPGAAEPMPDAPRSETPELGPDGLPLETRRPSNRLR